MRFVFCLVLTLVFQIFATIQAQQLWEGDAHWNYQRGYKIPLGSLRGNTLDTLTISAQTPFFDDFSQGNLEPDSQFWYTPDFFFDVPLVTENMAIDPPTRGVITFDGLSREGTPYAPNGLFQGEEN